MRWVESGDVRLAMFEQGDPSAPTVLMVHGYPDTHRVWDEVADLLQDRFHVVCYDVRGAGLSGAPSETSGYDYDHLAADLTAVLDAVGKPGVHLAGHDWGSIQGWQLIGRPGIEERILSFTSLGGVHPGQAADFMRHGKRNKVAGQLLRSWYIGAFQIPALPETVLRATLPRLANRFGAPARPGHPADTLVEDGVNGLGLYRANLPFSGGASDDAPLPQVPVQLVECTKDPFVSPALLASTYLWAPRLWHRRLHAGHWPQRSHPRVLAHMITEFVEHVEGAEPSRELRRAGPGERGPFDDRLVVITGAGSGIGRATARAFAAHGAEVICADIDLDAARRTVEGIADRGGAAHALRVDVADATAMEEFARLVKDRHGVADIVVNNAGIVVAGAFLDHSVEDWRRTLDVNLWGVIHGCRLFAAQMVERGQGGHIVNLASVASFLPTRLLPAYSVSKAAVKSLSDCLRAELAGRGIGVTAICPGFVSTPIAHNTVYVGEFSEGAEGPAAKAVAARGYPPERVAAHILRAVHRNLPVVPVNAEGTFGYALSRISPAAVRGVARLTGSGEISRLTNKR
ncbi:SDR family oxidoreductase [Streptosporangium sp. NPDC050855]|uniref:SDR family oxidoreductase n=1 Tax=Streptosporangium sp. NPDC050855 TaxID=3366194 RepID=UPI003789A36A